MPFSGLFFVTQMSCYIIDMFMQRVTDNSGMGIETRKWELWKVSQHQWLSWDLTYESNSPLTRRPTPSDMNGWMNEWRHESYLNWKLQLQGLGKYAFCQVTLRKQWEIKKWNGNVEQKTICQRQNYQKLQAAHVPPHLILLPLPAPKVALMLIL